MVTAQLGDTRQASEILQQGGVIAYPTEAVWGLGCDPDNEQAVRRILAIKQRGVDKGLLLVASDRKQIAHLLQQLTGQQDDWLSNTWPGPVTWLIPDPDDCYPPWIKGQHSSVAIRVSAHPVVQDLCRAFGKPVVSTSANLAGEPEIRSRLKLEQDFASKIDFIIEGELGGARTPSTIRDLVTGATLR